MVSLVLIISAMLLPAITRAGVEEKLPADTIAYAHWAGRSLTFDGSQFGQMIQQDSMMELLKVAFSQGFDQGVGMGRDGKKSSEALLKLIDIAWQRPITIAAAGLSKETGVQRAYLFIELGKDKPDFEKALNELTATLLRPNDKIPDPISFGNGSYTLIEMPSESISLAYGFSGEMFFITLGQAKTQAEAILTDPISQNLATNEKFIASMKDVGGPDIQAALYVDVESILAQSEELFFPPKPASTQPTTQPTSAPISLLKKITAALGVEKVTVVAGTLRIVDKGMLSKLKIFSPAPHTGILMPFAGEALTQADLSAIPADADFAMALNIDPTALLATIRKSTMDISPQASIVMNGALFAAGKPMGISIEKDIIDNLGDTWLISTAESQGGLLTGTVISVDLKNPEAFVATIAKIEGQVRRMLNPKSRKADGATTQPAPQEMSRSEKRLMMNRPRIEKMTVAEIEIHYLRTPASKAAMAFLPAWAVHNDRLYLALWPQVIASTLSNKTQPVTETDAFKKLQTRVSAKPSMLSYINTPQIVKRLYPIQLIAGTMISNVMRTQLGAAKLPIMPDTLENVLQFLQPEVGVVSHDETGITFEGFGSTPSLVSVPAGAALGTAIALPSLNRARTVAKKAISMTNLNGMGKGLVLYSCTNKDKYPEHLGLLIDEGFISAKALDSPVSPRPGPCYDPATKKLSGPMDYIYVYYETFPGRPDQLLQAYEDPTNYGGEGTNVLYCDSHVAWVDLPTFNKLLAESLEAGGKEVK